LISQTVGGAVRVIDSADQCAEDVARRLTESSLVRPSTDGLTASAGFLQCFVTDDSPRFGRLASRFLGTEIAPPTLVSTEELYALEIGASAMKQAV